MVGSSVNRQLPNLLASLHGLAEPGSQMLDRRAKPLDSVLEVLLNRYHIHKPRPEEVLMQNWRSIVGEQNAHGCAPEKIDKTGQLHVRVANPMLRRELMFRKSSMLRCLQTIPECDFIVDILFKAG